MAQANTSDRDPYGTPLLKAAEVQAFEREAFATGADASAWMEAAGAAAERVVWRYARERLLRGRVVVLCGPGNNGGDGYVLARRLAARGVDVQVYAMDSRADPASPGRRAAALWRASGGAVRAFDALADDLLGGARWPASTVVVDALFGVGWRRPDRGDDRSARHRARDARLATVIAALNRCGGTARRAGADQRWTSAGRPWVLALDVPTGLDADTGQPAGLVDERGGPLVLRADHTLTFIAAKRGLVTGQAAEFVGDLTVADLGQTAALERWRVRQTDRATCVDPSDRDGVDRHRDSARSAAGRAAPHGQRSASEAVARLRWCRARDLTAAECGVPRRRDAHKGETGFVHVLVGEPTMAGAAWLAARAAARAGAGRVVLWTDPMQPMRHDALSVADLRLASQPETMWRTLDTAAPAGASACVLGPGLGRDPDAFARRWRWVERHFRRAEQGSEGADGETSLRGLVLDADALRQLAVCSVAERRRFTAGAVLTPHPGEAAGVLGLSVAEVEAERFHAARRLAEDHAAIVVLKGAGTLVAAPDGRCVAVTGGHPGMASAGMGDVLAGVIAALLAQAQGLRRARVGVPDAADGAESWDAFGCVVTAVTWHLRAAERAAHLRGGEVGIVASDVVDALPASRFG